MPAIASFSPVVVFGVFSTDGHTGCGMNYRRREEMEGKNAMGMRGIPVHRKR
jgi:hypothetical protein